MSQSRPRTLIIGLGSIGQRHADLLADLGAEVAACTRRRDAGLPSYTGLEQALRESAPERVVIANPTAEHVGTLLRLHELGFSGDVLVEKPLFSQIPETPLPASFRQSVAVGYNLRFHPAVRALREALQAEEPVSAHLYVGQYLPTWRPGRDYRKSYSASVAQGGGVLRDLSHELDLGLWLFGPWQRLIAHGGHLSELEIETEDTVGLLWQARHCPKVAVEINYLDRAPRRNILVHTRRHTWEADMLGCRLLRDGEPVQSWTTIRNATYQAQDRAWLDGQRDTLCSFDEGLAVLHMIESIEASLRRCAWVDAPSPP
ncbi:MAG TPA: Gfo/Idh/MocA family oxidoreductase [Prosthecobacter sp.]|nr:Gfo/Idh/MocA family oxidoreductase [Prosthecobacter sp.]HRK16404.1 Gfo/Idh/MocA family oxidoreductase [Prosthecobacter sp.]